LHMAVQSIELQGVAVPSNSTVHNTLRVKYSIEVL
jgi:hypothetical protein